ncbi:hypothetical protein CK503_04785 [Aliifodinibius salipaludis]|uniref:Uncharacterized protein n=1 Tax=Fodinibius salipaludis TaxID=2032627 RepID=A0A2A2GD70_9BACT|nr:hypothetical protein [Aliifodinibius salipaludis]PAU94795.1 hypothetical protein CK503_04785 [Aliifodinibius salipaludis]
MIVIRNLIFCLIIAGIFFAGCSSTNELVKNDVSDQPVKYSVIYYIHADAGYLYHDPDGQPIRANSQVLETALEVAENAASGEVFIFYQRPEKKFLGLFPRKSNQFYHYTNGQKTTQVKYRHSNKKEPFLTTEAQLYNKYKNDITGNDQEQYFLYFGHEIPSDNGEGYHRTLPDIEVNTASFAGGVQQFLMEDDQILDLVVLSTCNNGTPAMASHLMPFVDHLLASPQNLHLSHIDTEQLGLLESNPGVSPDEVAHSLANDTFQRLEDQIQTTITLAEYDFESMRGYIDELDDRTASYKDTARIDPYHQNTDCGQFSFFDAEKYTQGIETWFKPAKFGRRATASDTHSGWGCRPLLED